MFDGQKAVSGPPKRCWAPDLQNDQHELPPNLWSQGAEPDHRIPCDETIRDETHSVGQPDKRTCMSPQQNTNRNPQTTRLHSPPVDPGKCPPTNYLQAHWLTILELSLRVLNQFSDLAQVFGLIAFSVRYSTCQGVRCLGRDANGFPQCLQAVVYLSLCPGVLVGDASGSLSVGQQILLSFRGFPF